MLKRWLEDSHALRGFTHELRQAARQWAARGRPADLVWRGQTAQEALSVSNRHLLDLSAAERDFLAAVREQVARGRRRKVFGFTAAFVVLGLVIGGGTIAVIRISAAEKVASQKAKDAEIETAKAKAAESRVQAQLDDVQRAKTAQSQAELDAQEKQELAAKATAGLALSREELQNKNAELERAIAEAKNAQAKAERAAKDAALAAETARKATEAEKASSAQLKLAVERERANVRKLEAEKSKIATSLKDSGGGLK